MSDKLVSVVIAAYNAEKYIRVCLDSILNQSYPNWEIWICDDSSTDQTLNIINEFAKSNSSIHVLHNETNLFAGKSRNRCIEQAKGYYIAIQDADDIAEINRLEQLVNAIETNDCDFVSSGHYLFDDEGIYKRNVPKVKKPQKRDFLFDIPFCHAATLFKKDCLLAVNGYRVSKETRRGQDYDMFMRLYAKGYKGINIDDLLYGYRVDRNTISRRKFRYRVDECIIRYKGFKALGLMPKAIPYVLKPIPAYFLQKLRRR
jgi:glycosyltransferase EpsE